jgi:hypothetical protein
VRLGACLEGLVVRIVKDRHVVSLSWKDTAFQVYWKMSSCRICFEESEEDSPLIVPCKCSGSIQYIHEGCLNQWIDTNHRRLIPALAHEDEITLKHVRCELCHERYKIRYNRPFESTPIRRSLKTDQFKPVTHFIVNFMFFLLYSSHYKLTGPPMYLIVSSIIYHAVYGLYAIDYIRSTVKRPLVYLYYSIHGTRGVFIWFHLMLLMTMLIHNYKHKPEYYLFGIMVSQAIFGIYPMFHVDILYDMNIHRRRRFLPYR